MGCGRGRRVVDHPGLLPLYFSRYVEALILYTTLQLVVSLLLRTCLYFFPFWEELFVCKIIYGIEVMFSFKLDIKLRIIIEGVFVNSTSNILKIYAFHRGDFC